MSDGRLTEGRSAIKPKEEHVKQIDQPEITPEFSVKFKNQINEIQISNLMQKKF